MNKDDHLLQQKGKQIQRLSPQAHQDSSYPAKSYSSFAAVKGHSRLQIIRGGPVTLLTIIFHSLWHRDWSLFLKINESKVTNYKKISSVFHFITSAACIHLQIVYILGANKEHFRISTFPWISLFLTQLYLLQTQSHLLKKSFFS